MLLIGIDQSPSRHDICIIDQEGRQLARFSVPHDFAGFERLHAMCQRLQAPPQECFVALESGYSFLLAYPTPQAACALSQAEFTTFCYTHHYRRTDSIARRFAQLQVAQTYASPNIAAAYAGQAQTLACILLFLVTERKEVQKSLSVAFHQHPDAFIFASLPGAGPFLAPALLSKFRDNRARFPTPAVAQAIAGTSPITIRSGKRRHQVRLRRACDREFRHIITQFARCSIREAPWAAAYFHSVLPRCKKASQAYRCLANRWIAIIWRLWMDRVEYDEAIHLRNRLTGRQVQMTAS